MVMESVVAEGFLDLPGMGSSDALIDRQCLPQGRGGLAAVAVVEVAADVSEPAKDLVQLLPAAASPG